MRSSGKNPWLLLLQSYSTKKRNVADENNRTTLAEGINLVMASAVEERETIFPWSLARETDKWSARPVQKQPPVAAIGPPRRFATVEAPPSDSCHP